MQVLPSLLTLTLLARPPLPPRHPPLLPRGPPNVGDMSFEACVAEFYAGRPELLNLPWDSTYVDMLRGMVSKRRSEEAFNSAQPPGAHVCGTSADGTS